MGQSLRDQLLKAGLAQKGQVRVVEQQKRRAAKQATTIADDPTAAAREAALQAAEEQRARDKQLNEARAAKRQRNEEAARLRSLLETHRLNNPHAPRPYRFQAGTRIKTVYITDEQFSQLQAGRLAVLVFEERIYLVASDIAERACAVRPGMVCHRPEPAEPRTVSEASQAPDANDDPYADYAVPDDLIW